MSNSLAQPVRAFIFDLDGTLIDSKMDLVNSVNAMLRATSRSELPTETIASYIGHGAPQLIASVLGPQANDSDRKSALAIFLAHYEQHCLDETRAYPGVLEGLAALTARPPVRADEQTIEDNQSDLAGSRLGQIFHYGLWR